MKSRMFVALALAAAMAMPASAAPARRAAPDLAAAVSTAGRPEDAVKLDEGRRPAEVLRFLGLRRGDRVADLFAGSGYYTQIMARAVGPMGYVLGWNFRAPSEEGRKAWDALLAHEPAARLLVAPGSALPLAPNSLDFTLIHLNYHDTYWESEKFGFPRMDPAAFVRQVYEATKPGGIVGVVDHVANAGGDTREVVEKYHRIDPATVRRDFEAAGFVLDAQSDLLRNPADDHSKNVFDESIRGKTDRFVYRFRKPAR
jgi:predicted methyltransferase